jgi:hypothetical protein
VLQTTNAKTMNKKNRSKMQYENLLSEIRQIIRDWDPYSLIREGAPDNEFDGEVSRLAVWTNQMKTSEDAIRFVSEVFSKSFEPKYFDLISCKNVGMKLFNRLRAKGFITE